jgi:hypothetical protein
MTSEDAHVPRVARLVTLVDLRDDMGYGAQASFSARHEAVLVDGRRVLLLDDRGWSASFLRTTDEPGFSPDVSSFWAVASAEDVAETSRFVVGPDEAYGERSQEDMGRDHWTYLAGILREQGVMVDPEELEALPHDVVLSETILSLLATS